MRYWSNRKIARWILGEKKPYYLDVGGWDAWHEKMKKERPIRYWISETALDVLQTIICYPVSKLQDISYYINNRCITTTHALTSNLKKGQWHEFDERMIHCLFDELVNFVEVETAWFNVVFDRELRKQYKVPFYAIGKFRVRTWRCPKLGIKHLEWQASLKCDEEYGVDKSDERYNQPTPQAIAAKEVLELYHWWKTVRLNRVDPYVKSGFATLTDMKDKELTRRMLDELYKIEKQYDDEDELMLVRLIKIRHHLWT